MHRNIFFMGVMRGGSSIVAQVLQQLAMAAGVEYSDPASIAYDQNRSIHEIDWAGLSTVEGEGKVYGIFRELPNWVNELDLRRFVKILVVRDPRDCLVSLYHARKFHSRNNASNDRYHIPILLDIDDIDQFCAANTKYFRDRFSSYAEFCQQRSDVLIYRYEDIAGNFPAFVDLCVQLLEIDKTHPKYADVIGHATLLKATITLERKVIAQESHNRSGRAQQFLEELRGESIEELTRQFSQSLSYFGYGAPVRALSRENGGDANTAMSDGTAALVQALVDFNQLLANQNGERISEIAALSDRLGQLEKLLGNLAQRDQPVQPDISDGK